MPLVLRPGTLTFEPARNHGPARPRAPMLFTFTTEVVSAVAAISGYRIEYLQEGGDHFVGRMEVQLSTQISGNSVMVDGVLGLRDWPDNWDDEYQGDIDFTLIADVLNVAAPPPRPDVSILDAEFNQATQHFRSSRHLDAVHVQPDNSIPLVANKPTGVRLYVQYDAGLGLPPITNLTGLLEVRSTTRGDTAILAPHMSQPNITPREDSAVSRAEVSHTLNFVIPAEWCRGSLSLRAQVWDAAQTPRQPSRAFQRVIQFTEIAPVQVWAIGVRFRGNTEPSAAEIQSLLAFANRIFPLGVGGFRIRGYSVLTVEASLDTRVFSNNECSRGMTLMTRLITDLRGSSDTDLHLGVFPAGVDLGSNPGCTHSATRSCAAGPDERVIAHEIGHAMPTGSLLQQYLTHPDILASLGLMVPYRPVGSIGEFGYDPVANRVFNPANTFDFMVNPLPSGMGANPFGPWISPDNYGILFGSLLSETSPAGRPGGFTSEPRMGMMLYLGLSISRDRTVERRASFHYQSWPTEPGGESSGFVVEFVDAGGSVLACHALRCACCGCGNDCWPKDFLQVVAYPPESRRMLVWEGRTKIYEEEILDPPVIKNIERELDEAEQVFRVKWEADPNGRSESDLWYLVHWMDDDGAWRGLAPRSQLREAIVPVALLRNRISLKMRVLATSGIATGSAEFDLSIPKAIAKKPSTQIVAVGAWAREEKTPIPITGLIEVAILDGWNRTLVDAVLHWHDEKQRQIGIGFYLDTQVLTSGPHTITASVWEEGEQVSRSWEVIKLQSPQPPVSFGDKKKDEKKDNTPP